MPTNDNTNDASGTPRNVQARGTAFQELPQIQGLGNLLLLVPGFAQGFYAQREKMEQQLVQRRQNLIDDLQQTPRFALNPGVQKEIKSLLGEESLKFYVDEAQRRGMGEQLLATFLGGLGEGEGAAPGEQAIGGGSMPQAAPTTAASQPPTPVRNVNLGTPPQPATQRRREKGQPSLLEQTKQRIGPGNTLSLNADGVTYRITGATNEEWAAAEFNKILTEVADAHPELRPEEAIAKAAQLSVGRINFADLPVEVRQILTAGTIEQKKQWVQTQFARIRSREAETGQREGRLEQPLADNELAAAIAQTTLDAINADRQATGRSAMSEAEVAAIRTGLSQDVQNAILRQRERTRMAAGLPLSEEAGAGVRALDPAALAKWQDAHNQVKTLANAVQLLSSTADNFGPFEGRFRNLLEAFGRQSLEYTQTKEALTMAGQAIRRVITGAQAGEKEINQLLARMPGPNDPPNVIRAKLLQRTIEALDIATTFYEKHQEQGFRISPLEIPPILQQLIETHGRVMSGEGVTIDQARQLLRRE